MQQFRDAHCQVLARTATWQAEMRQPRLSVGRPGMDSWRLPIRTPAACSTSAEGGHRGNAPSLPPPFSQGAMTSGRLLPSHSSASPLAHLRMKLSLLIPLNPSFLPSTLTVHPSIGAQHIETLIAGPVSSNWPSRS